MDKTRDLGSGPIGSLLVRYALPSIIGMVASALYNIVDRIFIGRGVGTLALAGVTVAFPLQLSQIAFSILIGVGAASLISISLGEQKREKAEQVLGNGFFLMLLVSRHNSRGIGIAFLDPPRSAPLRRQRCGTPLCPRFHADSPCRHAVRHREPGRQRFHPQ